MTRTRTLILGIVTATVLIALATTLVVLRPQGKPTDVPASVAAATTTASASGETGFDDPVTDQLGRKVLMPRNPAGVVQPQRDPSGVRSECAPAAPITSPEGVQIQRSFNFSILTSATDGPARLDGLTPRGYRRSPQGAALAGWNFAARLMAGGAPQHEALDKVAVLTPSERTQLDALSATSAPTSDKAAKYLQMMLAPEAFRVLSCDQDFVAVEWALRADADAAGRPTTEKWVGHRLNLLWRNGDWSAQMIREHQSIGSGKRYASLEGWTTWTW
ncbi:hypothetical protein [Nocardia sp. XZ_19_231]|uniref:hypothetical protein n=1 Tax=Nocardia sp. XZ_19_231 TaxID=2769252 RepID=UPI00188E33C2|nr:hypothetical protein [Nocardia sp. XZ_19_231]